MTTHHSDKIRCTCGHEGFVNGKENDQPFSGLRESYSLEGFEGEGVVITSYADMSKDLLGAMKPKCPKCGQIGKVKYATWS
jgi:hypothetical protein